MRKVFRDEELNKAYLANGYVVMDMLTGETCREMTARYEKIHGEVQPDSFFTTTHSLDASYRQICNDAITGVLAPYARQVLDGYTPLFGNFMVKPPNDRSACDLHQDWTFVEEENFRSVNVWVALQDTDVGNGCIHVIPGSHLLPFAVRGRNMSTVYNEAIPLMTGQLLVPVPLKKGQCIIFDSAILHYSPNNTSDRMRLGISLMLYPSDASLIHYVYDKEISGRITKYEVSHDFFVRFASAEDCLSDGGQVETLSLSPMSFESIRSLLEENAMRSAPHF